MHGVRVYILHVLTYASPVYGVYACTMHAPVCMRTYMHAHTHACACMRTHTYAQTRAHIVYMRYTCARTHACLTVGAPRAWAIIYMRTYTHVVHMHASQWELLERGLLAAPIRPPKTRMNASMPSTLKEEFAQWAEKPIPPNAEQTFAWWPHVSIEAQEELAIAAGDTDSAHFRAGEDLHAPQPSN